MVTENYCIKMNAVSQFVKAYLGVLDKKKKVSKALTQNDGTYFGIILTKYNTEDITAMARVNLNVDNVKMKKEGIKICN